MTSDRQTKAICTERLFPLAEPLLYPGVVQPLHIFESRYCEMIEDALADNRLITMAALAPGYDGQEYFSRPPLEQPVCIGQITVHEQTEEGTHNFMLAGVSRAIILEELPPLRSYREANVAIIDECDDVPEEEASIRRDELFQQLSQRTDAAQALGESLQHSDVPLARLIDALAVVLPLSREQKLEFAGEGSVQKRLDDISNVLRNSASD